MTDYEKARAQALVLLQSESSLTRTRIVEIVRAVVTTMTMLAPTGSAVVIDEARLVRDLEALVTWRVGREFIIDSDEDHTHWLPGIKGQLQWRFWDRYRRYLLEGQSPLPLSVVESVDDLTDKVLGRLEDPRRQGPWDRRGMIVGHVQSGKTSNFIGLICKAADAGYRVVIVLAGLHENLRAQTQMRVDEGFLGYSAAEATTYSIGHKPVGVGRLFTQTRLPAHSLTGYRQDFSGAKAKGLNITPFGHDPVILVVKKNVSILTNLLKWLVGYAEVLPTTGRRAPLPDVPALIIDDEADNASINTKPIPTDPTTGQPLDDYDVTKINGRIRQLLGLFSTSAYVGYTATPFANIFIHPDDRSEAGSIGRGAAEIGLPFGEGLFPRSFIISLPTPQNYVGPSTIFGVDSDPDVGIDEVVPLPLITPVDDSEAWLPRRHRSDSVPGPTIPTSLKRAIRSFVLACAGRQARAAGKQHNSMLVHVTRFVGVQGRVKAQVEAELKDIVNRLRYGDGRAKLTILGELKEQWKEDVERATLAVLQRKMDPEVVLTEWEAVEKQLLAAAQKIEVKRISGDSTDVLDYQNAPDGASVIAVGGDKLSRGLTLEGLSVSYFLRPSKMYDTLMQMGRWFGYRPGYLDLCRIYTTSDLVSWYRHIALASEELRREFELMVESNRTPRDYGLRVRSHPNGLWITSLVKMRESQTLTVSYDGRVAESTTYQRDEPTVRSNVEALNSLLEILPAPKTRQSYRESIEWSDVKATDIVSFLRHYRTHPHAPKVKSELLAHYVSKKAARGELVNWTVVLVSNREAGSPTADLVYPVGAVQRANLTEGDATKYTVKRLLSPADETYGLSEAQLAAALQESIDAWRARPADRRSESPPREPYGPAIRRQRAPEAGLLLLYVLDPSYAKLPYAHSVVGVGVSFPGDRLNPRDGVEYEANLVYVGTELGDEDFE